MSKKSKKKTKKRLNKKRVFVFLLILVFIIFLINIFNSNITNIYISGNGYLTDQEIIDIAKINNYPNTITNLSIIIKKRLEKNTYIYKAKVNKNILLNKVYIDIEENYPLFYSIEENKTILYDGTKIEEETDVVLTNSIPKKIYNKFINKFKKLDINILNRISEITYSPNEVLNDRFFLLMNDGNYVYITINKLSTLNQYLNIIKSFNGKKGVLYLDSGEYFDVFDE